MSTHYIHIGRNKCASSTLQEALAANRAALAENNVDYFLFGNVAEKLKGRPDFPTHLDYGAYVKAHPSRSTLISNEWFWNLPLPHVAPVVDVLNGADCRVIGYVRDYRSWLRSNYAYASQIGINTLDFDAYFTQHQHEASAMPGLERWASLVGWSKFYIRTLEPRDLDGGDIVSDCLNMLGAHATAQSYRHHRRLNSSPHWTAVEVVRALRLRYPNSEGDWFSHNISIPTHRLNTAALSKNPAPDVEYTSAEQSAWLDDLYNAELDIIDERCGTSLTKVRPSGAREFLPSLANVPKTVLDAMRDLATTVEFKRDYPVANEAVLALLK